MTSMEAENIIQQSFFLNAEQIAEIPIAALHPFPDYPYKIRDDTEMQDMIESIRDRGVLLPCLVRKREDGEYEIISGMRRKYASQMAEKETVPCIIREMDDDEAIIAMVDSNMQRENCLPSERAFAYKLKMEALKHQGEKGKINRDNPRSNWAIGQVADEAGQSMTQVHRYIRLTFLIPEMLNLVDDKKIAFNPAVELSFLRPEEQVLLIDALKEAQTSPSLSQAQRMKKLSQEGALTREDMSKILAEVKKPSQDKSYLASPKIRKFFPKSFTVDQIENTIIKLLQAWQRKRQQSKEL